MTENRVTGVKTVRTTISIPASLKGEMDAIEGSVNWSAVAARAFEQKLGDLAAKKKQKSIQDAVQRLRASKQAHETKYHGAGYEEGRKWAVERASWTQLQRLGERILGRGNWLAWLSRADVDEDRPTFVARALADEILGDGAEKEYEDKIQTDDRQYWDYAWQEVFLGRMYSRKAAPFQETLWREDTEFLRGFVEGAHEVYQEVSGRI